MHNALNGIMKLCMCECACVRVCAPHAWGILYALTLIEGFTVNLFDGNKWMLWNNNIQYKPSDHMFTRRETNNFLQNISLKQTNSFEIQNFCCSFVDPLLRQTIYLWIFTVSAQISSTRLFLCRKNDKNKIRWRRFFFVKVLIRPSQWMISELIPIWFFV